MERETNYRHDSILYLNKRPNLQLLHKYEILHPFKKKKKILCSFKDPGNISFIMTLKQQIHSKKKMKDLYYFLISER